ncbi:MAG: peptidoglycan-binding protein [Alphaproteobacteria bacterium]
MSRISDTVSFEELGMDRRKVNGALTGARNNTMLRLIGNPRGSYDQDCRHPTNRRIAALMATADLGPFRATGLRPAVDALRRILADVAAEHPSTHAALSTAGMLCCRLVRGSASAISNHAWGTAIDLKLEGRLDARGDGRTQRGLLEIAPIFNRHGFFWGAAFPTEDAMHFEASEALVRQWARDGAFGSAPTAGDFDQIAFGDRGPLVEALQERLNLLLAADLDVDGVFGRNTRAAVMEFQRERALPVSGTVDEATRTALERGDG